MNNALFLFVALLTLFAGCLPWESSDPFPQDLGIIDGEPTVGERGQMVFVFRGTYRCSFVPLKQCPVDRPVMAGGTEVLHAQLRDPQVDPDRQLVIRSSDPAVLAVERFVPSETSDIVYYADVVGLTAGDVVVSFELPDGTLVDQLPVSVRAAGSLTFHVYDAEGHRLSNPDAELATVAGAYRLQALPLDIDGEPLFAAGGVTYQLVDGSHELTTTQDVAFIWGNPGDVSLLRAVAPGAERDLVVAYE